MSSVSAKVVDSTHLELSKPVSVPPGESVWVSIHGRKRAPEPAPDDKGKLSHPALGRKREQAWYRANESTLKPYYGQWIVIEGEEIVGHGKDPRQLVEDVRAKGIRVPYLMLVEEPRPDVVKIGL